MPQSMRTREASTAAKRCHTSLAAKSAAPSNAPGDVSRARNQSAAAAKSLIAATDDDLVNLEVALHARQVRPDIRVVLRMFDHDLASKIRSGCRRPMSGSSSTRTRPRGSTWVG